MVKSVGNDWFNLSVEDVFKLLDTSPEGLSIEEAKERVIAFGYNELPEEKKAHELLVFILHFNDPLIYILVVSGLIAIFLGDLIDSIIIFSVVLINAILGYLQERSAEKTIKALKDITEVNSRVVRKKPSVIPAKDLVPGDVIFLESGMKVPADARVFETRSLRVDESLLTGESLPVDKFSERIPQKTLLKNNMVFAGTLVTSGDGKAVVVLTGGNTELGKITKTVKKEKKIETPLLKRVRRLGQLLLVSVVVISILNFIFGIYQGFDLKFAFLASVALMVAAVPESLPALITITLANGVRDMAAKKAIIRKLPAVETLGSVTTICTDKTGTLTQNRVKVIKIYTNDLEYDLKELGVVGDIKDFKDLYILKAGYICNKAVYRVSNGEYVISGDPTEVALLEAASLAGIKEDFSVIDEIPFDPAIRFMATAYQDNETVRVVVKGSPETIISMCNRVQINGMEKKVNHEEYLDIASRYANEGYRVLAFAYGIKEKVEIGNLWKYMGDLVFLGFQCMIDPPREEVYRAIRDCKRAGVKVVMVTGDHPSTALAIAKDIGIEGFVVTGDELDKMNDEEISKSLKSTGVFARTLPVQKFRIVKALQGNGEVVAVTGDGVNDAPALKAADIGVAMGSGTEVAKESSETIILDDNFARIVDSIEEGRNVFKKIQKVLAWTLPTNGGEASVILIAFLLGLSLPILPVQILWINTVTAVLLGTSLVFEQKEPGLLRSRPTKGGIITKEIAFRIGWVSLLMALGTYILFFRYESENVARTAAVNTIVFFEIFYLLSSRSLTMGFFETIRMKNPAIFVGILLTVFLQLTAVYNEQIGGILGLEPLDVSGWIEIIVMASSVFFISEFLKVKDNKKKMRS